MPVPTPSYITAAQVDEQSMIMGLTDLEDDDINSLIAVAEDQIDAFVGPQEHHPEDDNLDRVFPRVQDYSRSNEGDDRDTPVIPYKVTRATLRQVEFLYAQWWPTRATAEMPTNKPVTDEEIGGDGSYSASYAHGGVDFSAASLCDASKALLEGFRSRWAGISVTHPDDR